MCIFIGWKPEKSSNKKIPEKFSGIFFGKNYFEMHLTGFEPVLSPPEGDVLSIRLQVQMNSYLFYPRCCNQAICNSYIFFTKLNFKSVFDIIRETKR